MPPLAWARGVAKKILPDRSVDWYRRKRATRQYLEALSYELLERETRLDHLEGRVAARRDGFYQRIVTDVLERTEIILQELDRRIEGLSARSGQRLSSLEERLGELSEEIRGLRDAVGDGSVGPVRGARPADREGPGQAPSAVGE